MSPDGGPAAGPERPDDARQAVTFMATKFALFAVLPVIVAAVIVYFTLPG